MISVHQAWQLLQSQKSRNADRVHPGIATAILPATVHDDDDEATPSSSSASM
jgi:hypothetical protein